MAVSDLKLKQMVSGTEGWTGAQAALFQSIPEIAGLWPHVLRVHRQALTAHQASMANEQLQRMIEELASVDASHDHMLRACFHGLTALSEYLRGLEVPRIDEAKRYEALLATLLPEGLAWNQKSYAEEAGNAATVVSMLTPELEAMLERVPLGSDTLLSAVRRWGEVGRELARLERARSELTAALAEKVNYAQARSEWMTYVQLVLSNLAVSTAPKEQVNALRQPMLDLFQKAGDRAATRAEPAPAPAPTGEASPAAEEAPASSSAAG